MNQKHPIISFVVAIDKHRVMGCDNQLPWQMPADLQHFRQLTLNKPIIMGRKTYESIGRPLPLRRNIILTHDKHFIAEGCEIFHRPEDILNALSNEPEIMVIGGASLFELWLPSADCLHITYIDGEFKGDVFFPEWDRKLWQEVFHETHAADVKNPYDYIFTEWKRCLSAEGQIY